MRRRRGAACVHLTEAPPLVVLDRIGSRGGEASTTTSPTFRRSFRCANLQGYEDLIYSLSLFASPRLDLVFPVRIRRIFLIYYATKPFTTCMITNRLDLDHEWSSQDLYMKAQRRRYNHLAVGIRSMENKKFLSHTNKQAKIYLLDCSNESME